MTMKIDHTLSTVPTDSVDGLNFEGQEDVKVSYKTLMLRVDEEDDPEEVPVVTIEGKTFDIYTIDKVLSTLKFIKSNV